MKMIISIKLQKYVSGYWWKEKQMHKYKPKFSCLGLFALFGKTLNINYTKINK